MFNVIHHRGAEREEVGSVGSEEALSLAMGSTGNERGARGTAILRNYAIPHFITGISIFSPVDFQPGRNFQAEICRSLAFCPLLGISFAPRYTSSSLIYAPASLIQRVRQQKCATVVCIMQFFIRTNWIITQLYQVRQRVFCKASGCRYC